MKQIFSKRVRTAGAAAALLCSALGVSAISSGAGAGAAAFKKPVTCHSPKVGPKSVPVGHHSVPVGCHSVPKPKPKPKPWPKPFSGPRR